MECDHKKKVEWLNPCLTVCQFAWNTQHIHANIPSISQMGKQPTGRRCDCCVPFAQSQQIWMSYSLLSCCHFQVFQPHPCKLCAAGTAGAGWRRRRVAWCPSAQTTRGDEKAREMRCFGQKSNRGNAQLYPVSQRHCGLLLSSHGAGIPFIATLVNSLASPSRFIAKISELLLFPVKTFQLLRGRKKLLKQSGVCAVNGLHLSIQGNPVICMCATVQEFQCCICLGSHENARCHHSL